MWRRIPVRLGLTIFGVELISNNDIIDPNSPTAQKLKEQANKVIENETGWDRLKAIFHTDEFNALSPELDNTLSSACIGTFVGFCIGAIPASKAEYNDFISKNKATKFESPIEAKSKLQNNVTRAMAVGGWRIGWRLGLFTGAYTFFTTAVSTYRNKSSVFEYSAGGLLAGSMYKLPMGSRAMISGGLAGAVLGTVAGGISVGVMKLTGTTTEELRYWKQGWKEAQIREITSLDNPARINAVGPYAIAHDKDLKRREMQINMETAEKKNYDPVNVQTIEEEEKIMKNASSSKTRESQS